MKFFSSFTAIFYSLWSLSFQRLCWMPLGKILTRKIRPKKPA